MTAWISAISPAGAFAGRDGDTAPETKKCGPRKLRGNTLTGLLTVLIIQPETTRLMKYTLIRKEAVNNGKDMGREIGKPQR